MQCTTAPLRSNKAEIGVFIILKETSRDRTCRLRVSTQRAALRLRSNRKGGHPEKTFRWPHPLGSPPAKPTVRSPNRRGARFSPCGRRRNTGINDSFFHGDPRTFPRLDQHLRRHPSPRPNDRRSRGELRGRDDARHGLPPRSTSILTALPTGWPTVFTATSPPNATNSRRSLRPSNPAAARTPCVTPSAPTPPTASTAPTPTNATPPKSPSKNGPTRPTPYWPSCAVYPSISFAAAATKWPRPASSTSRRP